jgi:Spy/CpxP family protein refolding chaperone
MPDSSTVRRTTALVVLLFVIGIGLGSAGTFLCMRNPSQLMGHYVHPNRVEIVNRLSHDLNLTPDQRSRIESIVNTSHDRFHALDQQLEPQYDAIRQDARNKIRAVLTPEQKVKFEEEVRRLDEQRKKDMQQ